MKSLLRVLSAAILVLIAASCTDNGGSIYYSIQKVQKVATSVLPTDLTIADMVNVGAANASAPYYVATGGIFNGPLPLNGGINWQRVGSPAGMICNAMTWDGTNLWGGFFSTDGSNVGLYKSTLPVSSSSWLLDTPVPGGQVTYLTSTAAGDVFAVFATMSGGNFRYSLWERHTSTWTQLLSNLQSPVTGVGLASAAGFSAPGTYFVTTGNTVYWNSAAAANPPTLDMSSTSLVDQFTQVNDKLNGIFIDNTVGHTLVIVLARSGIYYSTTGSTAGNGSGWLRATSNTNNYDIGFLSAAGPIDNYTNGSVYLLGTDSNPVGASGFFMFNLTTPSSFNGLNGGLTRYVNPSISLYLDPIRRILVDANNNPVGTANNNIFFGTINSGLWRTSVDSLGNSQAWVQE